MRLVTSSYLLLLFITWICGGWNPILSAKVIIVSPQGAYTSLRQALLTATDGDTIEVFGGEFQGPLTIDKSVTLIGHNWPVIDGQFRGTVVEFTAPYIRMQGFHIRNSGISLSDEDAGIAVNTPHAHIENNRIENVLFGIYMRKADSSDVINNHIIGRPDLEVARRGDLIRAWYTKRVHILDNTLVHGRDMIIWFTQNTVVRNNSVTNARYGIHFMYSDDCVIEHNVLTGNSVGVYFMYSRRLILRNNTIAYNRGPSGFGIGVKDFDDGLLKDNLVVDNRVGIFVDNSPRAVDSEMRYTGNVIAYNDIGINMLSFVRRNYFIENSLIENYEQVGTVGPDSLSGNLWDNNYWSDYAGYDVAHDGIGDIPYKAEKFFENVVDRNPYLRLFIYSPAVQALDFAARAFPMVKPRPKLVDANPRITPYYPTDVPKVTLPPRWQLLWMALGLLFLSFVLQFGSSMYKKHSQKDEPSESSDKTDSPQEQSVNNDNKQGAARMIEAKSLTKRFGDVTAVNGISITINQGEAVALWGSNGAGKTTVLRCLLGIIPFDGEVLINGYNIRLQSKQARRLIGFVPQEINFHDNLTVQETIEFYARLKKTSLDSLQEWIERAGLTPHISKTIKELSGGMKQRLALAIALLGNPPILFLDEPTANLDMHSRDDFLELLTELKRAGKTIVYSSHRLEEVFGFADRIIVLDQGQIIADSPPNEVYQKLGRRSLLRLYIAEALIPLAMEILEAHGFRVTKNGAGIKVQVDSHSKGEPITLLATKGVQVNNFDYEIEKNDREKD